jgi:hypothetical protein
MAEAELPVAQRQRLVVYGSWDNPTIYTSVYDDDEAKSAVGECCARHGRTCGARVDDGVTVALKQQARNPEFGEVVGK